MKRFFFAIMALLLSSQSPAAEGGPWWGTHPEHQLICPGDKFIKGGDPSPWPWGFEDRFPWEDVQGVWAPVEGRCESLFSIKVRLLEDGQRVLQIHQMDPVRCERQGIGVGIERSQIITASMANLKGVNYDLTLRAFDKNKLQSFPWDVQPEIALVMTMSPRGDWESRKSYQLKKVAEVPQMICYKDQKDKK